MDRVLLIIDDIQYNRQVEMTLRKIGFEVESVNNEFNLAEPMLSFNPDYIVVRGNSNRLNVQNVGRKLMESSSHNNGKVILVFNENVNLSPDDLFKMRADLVLKEPLGTLKLVMYLISLTGQDIELIKEKLLKFAITDMQFRTTEQQLLRNAGLTIDSEIENLNNLETLLDKKSPSIAYFPSSQEKKSDSESNMLLFKDENKNDLPVRTVFKDEVGEKKDRVKVFKEETPPETSLPNKNTVTTEADFKITEEALARLQQEIIDAKQELPLRIDAYNRLIKTIDQDLKIGLKKRQTKKEFNKLHKDLLAEKKTDKKSEDSLDTDRVTFAKALFNKKKE